MSTFPAPDDNIRTLHDNLETSVSRYPHVPFLGTRRRDARGKLGPYAWITYGQAGEARTAIGSGLLQLGLGPKSAVGLLSINCKEWVLIDAALHSYSMISVPLYDTLGPDAVEYICNHAELAAVACSSNLLPVLLSCIPRCPTVKTLIVWGSSGASLPDPPEGCDVRIVTLDQVEASGKRHPRAHIPPKPSDVATLCYTSGTTGTPKGAVLSHGNLIATAAGTCAIISAWMPGDRHISYLPLAHIYERINLVLCTHLGELSLIPSLPSPPLGEFSYFIHTFSPHTPTPRLRHRVLFGQRPGASRGHSGPQASHLPLCPSHVESHLRQGHDYH